MRSLPISIETFSDLNFSCNGANKKETFSDLNFSRNGANEKEEDLEGFVE